MPRSTALVHALAWSAAAGACLSGALALLGWALDIPALTSALPGMPPMRPNAAIAVVCGGLALGLRLSPSQAPARRWASMVLATVMTALGAASLLEDAFGWGETGLDTLFLRGVGGDLTRLADVRPSPLASLCLVLLGPALALLDRRAGTGLSWMDALVLGAMLGALLGLNGLLLGPLLSSAAAPFLAERSMAMNTAVALLLLGAGTLSARPHQGLMARITRDTLGGFVARRLVPLAVLGPSLVALGLLVLNLAGALAPEAKLPLYATLVSAGGTTLVLLASRALDLLEAERRRATAALEASEARFRGLLETAPDPMVVVDANGSLRFINAQTERVFGYRREELLGREVEHLLPEGVYGLPRASGSPVADGGRALAGRCKNGREVPLEVRLSPMPGPEGPVLIATLRDVTEREQFIAGLHRAREEAETQRGLLQTVLDHAPLGILFVDPDKDTLVANAVAEELLGRPLNGRSRAAYLPYLRRADGSRMSPEDLSIARVLRTAQAVRNQEFALARPDGRLIPMQATSAPVIAPAGAVRGIVVTVQDITERRELERLREEYISLISHDLRNPLHTINLRANLLKRALRERSLEREGTLADAILHNVEWMSSMIEELLEGSRLESGRAQLRRAPCNLGRFLEEVLERDMPPDMRERFRLEVSATLPGVPVDMARLERVVTNLLSNALKYSPAGTPVVVRAAVSAERHAVVSVDNQGPGLGPEEAARIFDKYYRTPGGRSADRQGLGLGLYISRLIVEAHGGRIWVESAPGQGTTFSFALPLEDAAREPAPNLVIAPPGTR